MHICMMRYCIVSEMRPQELIDALRQQEGLSVGRLAERMGSRNFQGTLHRYLKSDTTAPEHSTAERIAKYFSLPLEAIYDPRVAARIANERGIKAPLGAAVATGEAATPEAPPGVSETAAIYEVKRQARLLPAALTDRIAELSAPQFAALTTVITAYLDGVAPSAAGTPSKAAQG